MASTKVTCISLKGELVDHARVVAIGGPNGGGWRMTVAQAVSTIERGVNEFYLLDANGRRLEIAIEQGPRRKHLRARGGGKWLDDLLTLRRFEL